MKQLQLTRLCDELRRLEQIHHNLSQLWPCGIRSHDDENDSKRDIYAGYILTQRGKIEVLRNELSQNDKIELFT